MLRRLLSVAKYNIRRYPAEFIQNRAAIRNLRADLAADRLNRTGYVDHYTEARELLVWANYEKAFASAELSEPVFRARYVRDLIRERIPKGSTVLNFGCSYGWLEGELSSDYRAVGIDRSTTAAERNREAFPKARFVAGDVFHSLRGEKIDVFCHINAGTYFLPRFISRLYAAAAEAGARYLVAFEPSGRSRQTGEHFEYSTEPRDSVVFRGPMLLNNYPQLMRAAGFEIAHEAVLHPPHPQKDFRSVCFMSARDHA